MDRSVSWPKEGMHILRELGFKTAAMALKENSVSIADPKLAKEEKLAVILGTEGDGLLAETHCRLRLYGNDSDVTRCGFAECRSCQCGCILAVRNEELLIKRM